MFYALNGLVVSSSSIDALAYAAVLAVLCLVVGALVLVVCHLVSR